MIIRECTYTESYMNRHGPVKYTNRYGDQFTFLLNEDGDLIMEGNFEHFRFGYSNIYGVAYREYIKDTNSDISLDEFKKLVHRYNDETGTWELETDKYRKLVVTSDEYNMIDPSGGPYITLGMEAKLFHPDTEGKIIGKIIMLEKGVKLVLIEKGKGEQRELLKQMMEDDENDGLYET